MIKRVAQHLQVELDFVRMDHVLKNAGCSMIAEPAQRPEAALELALEKGVFPERQNANLSAEVQPVQDPE